MPPLTLKKLDGAGLDQLSLAIENYQRYRAAVDCARTLCGDTVEKIVIHSDEFCYPYGIECYTEEGNRALPSIRQMAKDLGEEHLLDSPEYVRQAYYALDQWVIETLNNHLSGYVTMSILIFHVDAPPPMPEVWTPLT